MLLDNLSDHIQFCSAFFRLWFDINNFKLKNFKGTMIDLNAHVAGLNKGHVKQETKDENYK